MLTLIAIPKPFKGHIGIIQTNAIKSWTLLNPRPEIILLGDEEGTKEIVTKFQLRHVPDIEKNEYGTPLFSSIFQKGREAASNDWLCYTTSDVIFTSDLLKAYKLIREYLPKCHAIARRWNLEINELIDFSQKDWETQLKSQVSKFGRREGHTGSDISIFPKDLFGEIPPFAVRPPFDNWLFYYTRVLKVPLVDISEIVTIIHQYHEYPQYAGGQKGIYTGVEAKRNLVLAGGYPHLFTIRDCDYRLTENGLIKRKNIFYSFYRWLVTYSGVYWFFSPIIKLIRLIKNRKSSFYQK